MDHAAIALQSLISIVLLFALACLWISGREDHASEDDEE